MTWPLLLQAFATFAMTGLIWFVQVVHYPLFRAVAEPGYAAYQDAHMRLTTLVVGPLMLLEAATALWLVHDRPGFVPPALAWTGLALLAVIWLSTARPRRARGHELDPDGRLDGPILSAAPRPARRPPLIAPSVGPFPPSNAAVRLASIQEVGRPGRKETPT